MGRHGGGGKWKLGVNKVSCKKEKAQLKWKRWVVCRNILTGLFKRKKKKRQFAMCRTIRLVVAKKENTVPKFLRREICSCWWISQSNSYGAQKWMVQDHQTYLWLSIFLLDWATAKTQLTFLSQDCFWQTTAKDKFMSQSVRFKICDKTLCWIKIWISYSISIHYLPLLMGLSADIVNSCL